MPIETAAFIDGLDASNPVGSTDKVQTLDDHIRLLKSAIKASFPGVAGAVTPTHTELNYVDGVTSAIQTQLDAKAAANALNASNLTSGTVPDARFPATLPALNGSALTSLNGTAVATGTVADARLSANVPLLNASNAFTNAANQFSASNVHLVLSATGTTPSYIEFDTNSVARSYIGAAGATNDIITGSALGDTLIKSASGGLLFSGDGGTTAHFKLSSSGALTTPCASAQEVGTSGVVARAVSASTNTAATDMGRCVLFNGGSGQTFTLDADVPTNGIVVLVNESGNSWTIAASGTLIYGGVTGSRTLPDKCMAVAYHRQGSGTWQISGQLT